MSGKALSRSIAFLLGVGLITAGCGQDRTTSITSGGSTKQTGGTSVAQGTLSVRILSGTQTSDKSLLNGGERHPLEGLGIKQLTLTFGTVRLYLAPDSLVPDSLDSLPPWVRHDPRFHHGPPSMPDTASYIDVLPAPITVDMTQLADTLGALLTAVNVPAGKYSHLALGISSASAVTDSGVTVPVAPSAPDSLLRVFSQFTVTAGQTIQIEIKIDLDRSVQEIPPGSGTYVLTPVLFGGEEHGPGPGLGPGPGGGGCPGDTSGHGGPAPGWGGPGGGGPPPGRGRR